jgi:acetyltransferase-like isoleucine patch superfamily enzyme
LSWTIKRPPAVAYEQPPGRVSRRTTEVRGARERDQAALAPVASPGGPAQTIRCVTQPRPDYGRTVRLGSDLSSKFASLARRGVSDAINSTWRLVCQLGAIGPDHPWARRFGAFGDGSAIAFPPGIVFNERSIRIGSNTLIAANVSLSAGMQPGQEMISDPVVSIGDRTLIGQGSYIVGHFCIEIGDDVQTGPYVYITDQNHGYEDPDVPIGRQWPVDSTVHIGSGSWLGAGVIVLPGSRIGRNVVVGAGSVVNGELPDHCVAVGSPAQVVKRYVSGTGWSSRGLAQKRS